MSIFDHRKPASSEASRDALSALRITLEKLESEVVETPRIADLKRILAHRIAEIEGRTA